MSKAYPPGKNSVSWCYVHQQELADCEDKHRVTARVYQREAIEHWTELQALKDALVAAIGSPKDRDRLDIAVPSVIAGCRMRTEKAEEALAIKTASWYAMMEEDKKQRAKIAELEAEIAWMLNEGEK